MKITRLKKGVRISLTDSEFEALRHLVQLGKSDIEGDDMQLAGLSPAGKRAIRARFSEINCFHIDEDRRA